MNVYNVNMDGYNNANFPYISAFHSNASYAGIENAIARHGLVWQFASGIMLTRGIGRWSWWRQQRTRVCTRCQAVFCLPKTLWRNNTQNSCNIAYEHEQYSLGQFQDVARKLAVLATTTKSFGYRIFDTFFSKRSRQRKKTKLELYFFSSS